MTGVSVVTAGVTAGIIAALVGYLIGGLPSAALVARLKGKRIFEVGSGNMGAMNTARNVGWGLGVLVLIMDVAKGVAAGALGLVLGGEVAGVAAGVAAGCGAVAGHAWSPFVGFRGGKALSTALGVALPIYPLVGLGGLALLVAFMVTFRRTPLAPVFAIALYPFLAVLVLMVRGEGAPRVMTVVCGVIIISGISAAKHLRALRVQPGAA